MYGTNVMTKFWNNFNAISVNVSYVNSVIFSNLFIQLFVYLISVMIWSWLNPCLTNSLKNIKSD